jgi:hypothetical protein
MSAKPPPLAESIEISKFWKTRRRDKAIVISLSASSLPIGKKSRWATRLS